MRERKEVEVGVKALRDHLSNYLRKVEQGAEVIVTRRGKPIVQMTPVD